MSSLAGRVRLPRVTVLSVVVGLVCGGRRWAPRRAPWRLVSAVSTEAAARLSTAFGLLTELVGELLEGQLGFVIDGVEVAFA